MRGSVLRRSRGLRLFDLPASTSAGSRALRLVAGGLAFAVACILLNGALGASGIDASIGPLHLIAAFAFMGLLAVVAGGVIALFAISARGGALSRRFGAAG